MDGTAGRQDASAFHDAQCPGLQQQQQPLYFVVAQQDITGDAGERSTRAIPHPGSRARAVAPKLAAPALDCQAASLPCLHATRSLQSAQSAPNNAWRPPAALSQPGSQVRQRGSSALCLGRHSQLTCTRHATVPPARAPRPSLFPRPQSCSERPLSPAASQTLRRAPPLTATSRSGPRPSSSSSRARSSSRRTWCWRSTATPRPPATHPSRTSSGRSARPRSCSRRQSSRHSPGLRRRPRQGRQALPRDARRRPRRSRRAWPPPPPRRAC